MIVSHIFTTYPARYAHAEQFHNQSTSWLEHLFTQPQTGLPLYVGGIVIIFIMAKLLHSIRLALPLAAGFSLLIAIFIGDSYALLSLIAASVTAVLALIAVFEVIVKHEG